MGFFLIDLRIVYEKGNSVDMFKVPRNGAWFLSHLASQPM